MIVVQPALADVDQARLIMRDVTHTRVAPSFGPRAPHLVLPERPR